MVKVEAVRMAEVMVSMSGDLRVEILDDTWVGPRVVTLESRLAAY